MVAHYMNEQLHYFQADGTFLKRTSSGNYNDHWEKYLSVGQDSMMFFKIDC